MADVPDLAKADAKEASVRLILKADSGYRAEAKYDRISANQWADIIAACEDGERRRVARAGPDLLAALERLVPSNVALGNPAWPDDTVLPIDVTLGELRQARAAIKLATQPS